MYRIFVSIICLFLAQTSFSKEFEGIVTYSVKVVSNQKGIKLGPVKKTFGKKHLFYYKQGAHKWVSAKTDFAYEIYNPNDDAEHVYSKYRDSENLIGTNITDSEDTVTKVVDLQKLVIAGKTCRGYRFHIENEKGRVFTKRTWYCPTSGYEFGEDRYFFYKANGQRFLIQHCGSVPFKMILEWPGTPFSVVYEAVKIEEIPLDDSIFKIDSSLPKTYED